MTITQKKKILQRLVQLESDIEELKRVRKELLVDGFASATCSTGGSSKSYTKLDTAKINEALNQMTKEMKQLRALLNCSSPAMPNQIYTIYN